MIGAIIFLAIVVLLLFSVFMVGYYESDFWAVVAIISFIGLCVCWGITPQSSYTEKEIQYQQDILELKLLEQRIELFDLQIEQLKLNINNK